MKGRCRNAFLKIAAAVLIAVFCFSGLLSACVGKTYGNTGYGGLPLKPLETRDCFSVNFIDVGEGDAIFINFNDGKTMLIDCGEKSQRNYNAVKRFLEAYTDGALDYLVLTHPDGDHVGNAAALLKEYEVKTAFVPFIVNPERFELFNSAFTAMENGGTEIIYSATYLTVCGEDYYAAFLSPDGKDAEDSAYTDINSRPEPSADEINAVSPIIYLDYKGVRFVFTGDAGFSQEQVALNNVRLGLINRVLSAKGKSPVNLFNVDFLKVSHHGSADASGAEFLRELVPQNAVISVGGNNGYNHPATATLSRIHNANADCRILRTDAEGNISVFVDANGKAEIVTDGTAVAA